MSGSATVQTQHQTIQVLSATSVRDVMEVGFTTIPHGVYAVVRVPLEWWKQFGSDAFVDQVASLIEAAFAIKNVTGASYAEDVDANGLLAAFIDFNVHLTPTVNQTGPMEAIARVPITQFTEPIAPLDAVRQPILDTVAALELTANG